MKARACSRPPWCASSSPMCPRAARIAQPETVDRLYRIGADFSISSSEVSGQLLVQHSPREECISVERNLELSKIDAGAMAGSHPLERLSKGRSGGWREAGRPRDGEFPEKFLLKQGDACFWPVTRGSSTPWRNRTRPGTNLRPPESLISLKVAPPVFRLADGVDR